jgi:hypothetical protein
MSIRVYVRQFLYVLYVLYVPWVGVNLRLLESRLRSTCAMRVASPRQCRRSQGTSGVLSNISPCSWNWKVLCVTIIDTIIDHILTNYIYIYTTYNAYYDVIGTYRHTDIQT